MIPLARLSEPSWLSFFYAFAKALHPVGVELVVKVILPQTGGAIEEDLASVLAARHRLNVQRLWLWGSSRTARPCT